MAIDDRYVPIGRPPQTGETLASLPLLENYAEVLNVAEKNVQNGEGAYYVKKASSREVSYCYIMNSIYRELLKWQNKQPDNQDIVVLRQAMVSMFKYAVKQEFPHIGDNYEIKPDFIEFDTKDYTMGGVFNPQSCDIGDKSNSADEAVMLQYALPLLDKFLNNNELNQVYEEGSQQEREQQKRFDTVSFGALRKMQYYLAEKIEGKQVYSFQTTTEKTRAHRNTLQKQITALTNINKDNASGFEANQQVVSNTLDGLGMRMVWCQEPPYEAEFVDHLYEMKNNILHKQTSPEFYNTKLPILQNLCKNMEEFNPEETKKMSALFKEFTDEPSEQKLVDLIEETQRVALELRSIDDAKSKTMRAAWNGEIRHPARKNISPVIIDVLKTRDLVYRQSLTETEKIKRDAYLNADYALEDYQKELQKSKIWNVCAQMPQFKSLETELLKQMKSLSMPPQSVSELKYDDFAMIINQGGITNRSIASDREVYVKNLVAKNEKELRRMFTAFYKKKHTLALTLAGKRKGRSKQEISESIRNKAQKETDRVIKNMQKGFLSEDFNAHHIFPLSNISYFERITGKSFAEINKSVVFINKGIHELLHMNENSMDKKGHIHLGKDMACRTKYIHQDRAVKQDEQVIGYYDRATMGIIMPKDGITAMVDFDSYLFEQNKLSENIKLQQQSIEYRKASDAYSLSQAQNRAINILERIPEDESKESSSVSLYGRLLEGVSSPREYCSIANDFRQLKQDVFQNLQNENRKPTATEQAILKANLKYYQPLVSVPHIPNDRKSSFLTQAVEILHRKAKEIVMSVQNTLQAAQPLLHPEFDKARNMLNVKSGETRDDVKMIPLYPKQSEQKMHVTHKFKEYA